MKIIIGMAAFTVGSLILEKILAGAGKPDESIMVGTVTRCSIAVTALAAFSKALVELGKLAR